ncbi:MAG: Holliday junction resolvase RuvX [Bacteroidales bacterium]|nr:Holliday junction resolvase RuvX [Bacteroidales bacterium]HOY37898.1 Holliday junction resolvase RuvX [Bacteroidales bacterium]HQP03855.1 Holliday junction resolvase RuvX [Bacteroidales bacterium]
MPRWIALDIGKKRTGVAVTDKLGIIATALGFTETGKLSGFLQDYLAKESVDLIIVGYPRNMNNLPSDAVKYIEPVVTRLKKLFADVHFVYYDERFTSQISFQAMIDGGVKKMKRRNKGLVDQISAVLILQAYMDYVKNTKL